MTSTIEVKGVVKQYDRNTRALNGVTVSMDEGKWTVIVGPSGSGKTTLLNILGCLDSITEGSVIINETEISKMKQKALTAFRRENVGLIFQQYHLIPYLTALENVKLAQHCAGVEDDMTARAILEKVGMGHRLHHTPSQLSGGEQQRVCIARALVNAPAILLADEPTGNLDQENGRRVLELISKLRDDGHTIVMVTHDSGVARMGDRIIRLVDGKIVADSASGSGMDELDCDLVKQKKVVS